MILGLQSQLHLFSTCAQTGHFYATVGTPLNQTCAFSPYRWDITWLRVKVRNSICSKFNALIQNIGIDYFNFQLDIFHVLAILMALFYTVLANYHFEWTKMHDCRFISKTSFEKNKYSYLCLKYANVCLYSMHIVHINSTYKHWIRAILHKNIR